jgi:hypothetical protein
MLRLALLNHNTLASSPRIPITTMQPQTALLEPASQLLDALTPYRCYSLAETGHILALVVVNCADEESAKQLAASKFRDDPQCRVIEVWGVGRRVARLRAPAHWH